MTAVQAVAQASGLRVRGCAVELAGKRVLDGIDLDLASGEFVGLLGPNGAGKTTLLRSLLGVQRVAAGQLSLAGRPIQPGMREIGYVPQRHEFAWDFPASVAQVVLTGRAARSGWWRRVTSDDWQAVAEALRRVRLSELAERPVGQLSGGQRQRVLVARALVNAPATLLLDEPFTGLDVPSQTLLTELFVQLAEEGCALLMSTHDLIGALDSCTRVLLLNRTLVADGSPAELAADAQAWTRTFEVPADSALLRVLEVFR